MKVYLLILLFISAAFLSGCEIQAGVSNYQFKPSPIVVVTAPEVPLALTEEFNIPKLIAPKVDVLFVVDNSGSMADEQQVLANSFSSFIDQFALKNIDFQIGVVSTDVTAATNTSHWGGRAFEGYLSPSNGNLLSKFSEKFLSNSTHDLINKFKSNVLVGTTGSGSEQGLQSALLALDEAKLSSGSYNEGFIRDDSLLEIIVVSDEDEYVSPDLQLSRIASFKDRLSALKSSQYRVDFVINKNASIQKYTTAQSVMYYPDTYLKAAQELNASTFDIRSDFSSSLVNIGASVAKQAQSEYPLSSVANPESILVSLNDIKLNLGAPDGFLFHAERNTIELTGAALLNSPGLTLKITYTKK